jgi:hypothetical protein
MSSRCQDIVTTPITNNNLKKRQKVKGTSYLLTQFGATSLTSMGLPSQEGNSLQ